MLKTICLGPNFLLIIEIKELSHKDLQKIVRIFMILDMKQVKTMSLAVASGNSKYAVMGTEERC